MDVLEMQVSQLKVTSHRISLAYLHNLKRNREYEIVILARMQVVSPFQMCMNQHKNLQACRKFVLLWFGHALVVNGVVDGVVNGVVYGVVDGVVDGIIDGVVDGVVDGIVDVIVSGVDDGVVDVEIIL